MGVVGMQPQSRARPQLPQDRVLAAIVQLSACLTRLEEQQGVCAELHQPATTCSMKVSSNRTVEAGPSGVEVGEDVVDSAVLRLLQDMNGCLVWLESKKAKGHAVSIVRKQGKGWLTAMPSLIMLTPPGMGLDTKQEVNWGSKDGVSNQSDTWMNGIWCLGMVMDQSCTVPARQQSTWMDWNWGWR